MKINNITNQPSQHLSADKNRSNKQSEVVSDDRSLSVDKATISRGQEISRREMNMAPPFSSLPSKQMDSKMADNLAAFVSNQISSEAESLDAQANLDSSRVQSLIN
ncbi:MAG: hypothetical protein JXR95_09355 [Deltaproteobacteria bacterium]|nr:hypothetical protein [Deltaproteobacteria bacterium]